MGANNDINLFNFLDLFNDVLQEKALAMQYTLNGAQYNSGYYLIDEIYP